MALQDFKFNLLDVSVPVDVCNAASCPDDGCADPEASPRDTCFGVSKLTEHVLSAMEAPRPSPSTDQFILGALYILVALAQTERCRGPVMSMMGPDLVEIGRRALQNSLVVGAEVRDEVCSGASRQPCACCPPAPHAQGWPVEPLMRMARIQENCANKQSRRQENMVAPKENDEANEK